MDEIIGNTVMADPVGKTDQSAVAQLAAQAEAAKALMADLSAPPVVAPVAPVETQTQVQAPAPETKVKSDPLQPFKDKEGTIDPQRIEKANESLRRETVDREARIQQLLKQNKELQKEFTKKSMEMRSLEKAAPQVDARGISPELRKQILADLEKDPVEAIFKAAEIVAESRVNPIREQFAETRQESRFRKEAESLDSLGQAGHPWVYTKEGQEWFAQKFQEEPGLMQMSDPYRAAVRQFSDEITSKEARQAAEAPASRGTPVLGVSQAVPPPMSKPTETPELKLADLNSKLQQAFANRDMAEANRIGLEMRKLSAQVRF